MPISSRVSVAFTVASLLCLSQDASAQTSYASRALFQAAISNSQTVDFEGLLQGGEHEFLSNAGQPVVIDGVTFQGNTGELYAIWRQGETPGTGYNRGSTILNIQSSGDLVVSFGTPIFGFGLDLANYYNSPSTVGFALSNGDTFSTIDTGANNLDFFGFTTSQSFSSVTISHGTNYPIFDNVEYGNLAVTATPEPASLLLLASGLLGVVGVARSRKRAA